MEQLVRQIKLGDITFGMPGDIALLNSPWGFYEFLGVLRDALPEDIRKAYRDLSRKFHPDAGGKPGDFENLKRVAETLLDDGGELGPEHSQRRHYDEVSSLDEYFNGFIKSKEERTQKLSEAILAQMQIARHFAKFEHRLSEKNPEFNSLRKDLEKAESEVKRKKILERMQQIADDAIGVTPEMREEFKRRCGEDFEGFLKNWMKNSETYYSKILDILYVGNQKVIFGTGLRRSQIGVASYKDGRNILRLTLGGVCYIAGFQQAHFKAEEAYVYLTDPNLKGIFHVVNGLVSVDYESSSYGGVIRARAPEVRNVRGFEQRGDLYVPSRFATWDWHKRNPDLDIAVKEGTVELSLRSPEFARVPIYGKFIETNSLESIVREDVYNGGIKEIKKYY